MKTHRVYEVVKNSRRAINFTWTVKRDAIRAAAKIGGRVVTFKVDADDNQLTEVEFVN